LHKVFDRELAMRHAAAKLRREAFYRYNEFERRASGHRDNETQVADRA